MALSYPLSDVLCCQARGYPDEGPYIYSETDVYNQKVIPLEHIDERLEELMYRINSTSLEDIKRADPRLVLDGRTRFLIKLRYFEPGVCMREVGFLPMHVNGDWEYGLLYTHESSAFYNPVHNNEFIDTFVDEAMTDRFRDSLTQIMRLRCEVHNRHFDCRIHERRRRPQGTIIWGGLGKREWEDTTEKMEQLAVAAGFQPSSPGHSPPESVVSGATVPETEMFCCQPDADDQPYIISPSSYLRMRSRANQAPTHPSLRLFKDFLNVAHDPDTGVQRCDVDDSAADVLIKARFLDVDEGCAYEIGFIPQATSHRGPQTWTFKVLYRFRDVAVTVPSTNVKFQHTFVHANNDKNWLLTGRHPGNMTNRMLLYCPEHGREFRCIVCPRKTGV